MEGKENNLEHIQTQILEINCLFKQLDSSLIFFSCTHQSLRFDITEEAAWQNNIDFFYGLLYERCDIYWNYIVQKMQIYNLNYQYIKEGRMVLHDLRTYKNHTLDRSNIQNKRIIDNVEKWYFKIIGDIKYDKKNIKKCADACNEMVIKILGEIIVCVNYIMNDIHKGQIVIELKRLKDHNYPDWYIEQMFNRCVSVLELQNINTHHLTERYGRDIREKAQIMDIKLLSDRDNYIMLYIEEIIFSERMCWCPLSAEKIMKEYNISPGRELGVLKQKAIELAYKNLYISEKELLDKLRELYPDVESIEDKAIDSEVVDNL